MLKFFRRKKEIKNVVIILDEDFYPKSNNPHLEEPDYLWNDESVYNIAKYSNFIEDKKKYYNFYNNIRNEYRKLKPSTKYHKSLLEIFKNFNLTIINTGIDESFEKIGFKNVIHPKGINSKLICGSATFGCGEKFRFKEFNEKTVCKKCGQKEHLRPNIDWVGEASDSEDWNKARIACENANLIVFIGKNCRRAIFDTLLNLNTECKKVEIAQRTSDILGTEFHYSIRAQDNIMGLEKLKKLLPIYLKG